MKKKYVLLVLIVFIFQVFASNFSYVKAEANTSICAGPSETMSLYFDFQNEMQSVLLGSSINERRFSVSMRRWWLFRKNVLELKNTALDLVANSIWNRAASAVSTTVTSAVLVSLSAISIAQSSTEWLAVLFRDRPIVRDYKTMMDIETDLFDIAYFRSKQVNLISQLDWEMHDQIKSVIKKYQGLWLLDGGTVELNNNVSIADVLWDLVWMNAAMKHFIVYDSWLKSYHWCMSRSQDKKCSAVLKFSAEAIKQLKFDYKWTFGKCNSNFKSLISKSTSDSFKSGWKDVKDAMGRLKTALVWGKSEKNEWCDLSDYEMAQIRAYRWDDWTCDEAVKLYADLPYVWTKKAKQDLRKWEKTSIEWDDLLVEWSSYSCSSVTSSKDKVYGKPINEMRQERFNIYGEDSEFEPEYLLDMDADISQIYCSIKTESEQSEWVAQASDLSLELIKIRWLIEQIGTLEEQAEKLEERLEKIANYQCAG